MNKIAENKTRKKLRISLCVFYLLQVVLCTFPYFQEIDVNNKLQTASVFEIIFIWGMDVQKFAQGNAAVTFSFFMPLFVIIPLIGFFFCAFDKERNLKNVISILCCLLGVLAILLIVGFYISLGSLLALLLYLLICFITTISIFARYTKDPEENKEEK